MITVTQRMHDYDVTEKRCESFENNYRVITNEFYKNFIMQYQYHNGKQYIVFKCTLSNFQESGS